MSFSTTITKKYFEMKQYDLQYLGFFEEYKNYSDFWIKRYANLRLPCNAVFLVGSKPHKFVMIDKKIISHAEVPEKYFSAITTDKAFAFRCVE